MTDKDGHPGRKNIWMPQDIYEDIKQRCEEYKAATGQNLSMHQALIEMLDEYDVLKDAERLGRSA